MKKIIILFSVFIIFNSSLIAQLEIIKDYKFLDVGQMKVRINPHYLGEAWNTATLSSVQWPGGREASKSLSLPWVTIGGIKNGIKHAYGTQNLARLIPGKILSNGKPDNPLLEKYRAYKIRKGWETLPFGNDRDQYEKDYNEWPIEDGAPWEDIDGNGIFTRGIDRPLFIGDETVWYVNNDMDTLRTRNVTITPSDPLGLEFQSTLFAFNRSGVLGDVYFYKLKIINKSEDIIDSFFVTFNYDDLTTQYWNYGKFAGYDSLLNMSFTYKAQNLDFDYSPPAAAGHLLLQGPVIESTFNDSAFYNGQWIQGYKNSGFSSFQMQTGYLLDRNPFLYAQPFNIEELFNNFNGLLFSGKPIIDPNALQPTKFAVPGDPVNGIGWYEGDGWPIIDTIPRLLNGYRYLWNTLGPYTFLPNDTIEIVMATLAAQGTDNLNSITELKKRAGLLKKAYELNFQLTPLPPKPEVTSFTQEDKVTLWWKTNAENYDEEDPLIFDQQFSDTTYTFEGYIIRQHRDTTDYEGKIIAIYDEENGVSVIEDYVIANGVSVKLPVIIGNDEGLRRFITIDKDALTNSNLYNGNPYYFSVTSYAYSRNSSPSYLESEKKIIELIPGREKIDYSSEYKSETDTEAEIVSGASDGKVLFRIIDPNSLTGDKYEVKFRLNTNRDTTFYNLVNLTKSDTIIKDGAEYGIDTVYRKITDGFMFNIINTGKDSINRLNFANKRSAIKSITMDGEPAIGRIIMPVNNGLDDRQGINWRMNVGRDDYEIRFTESGSEYYTTGYLNPNPQYRDDPKGKGRVPFEIWNITKNERLLIKIMDRTERDTSWSQSSEGIWESIYAYKGTYNEPLPQSSGTSISDEHILGEIKIIGEILPIGKTIRIETFKPFSEETVYEIILNKAEFNNKIVGKENTDKITVFPNPYYARSEIESGGQSFIRFGGVPTEISIRIYTIAGTFVRKIEKSDINQYIDWDLRNEEGNRIASGIYIAHLEMPGIGEKILKVAVVMGKEYLNR